jgi:hypothetical protein
MSLEEILKQWDKKPAVFQEFRDGELWYRTSTGSEYPAPMTYKGDAAFHIQENAVHLIR